MTASCSVVVAECPLKASKKSVLEFDEVLQAQGDRAWHRGGLQVERVLGEDVEGGFFLEAFKLAPEAACRPFQVALCAGRRGRPRRRRGLHLDEEAVAVLQGIDERAGIPPLEKMQADGFERPRQIEGVEGFHGLEKIALAEGGTSSRMRLSVISPPSAPMISRHLRDLTDRRGRVLPWVCAR